MTNERRDRRGNPQGRLWKFGPTVALASTMTLLIVLIAGFALMKNAMSWPGDGMDRWVLLGVFALALAPLILLVLDRMSLTGGTLEVRGIKVAFAAVMQEQSAVVVPKNMGVPAGLSIADSGGGAVLAALKEFSKHDLVVVDLEDGTAWWETRLSIVCAGAARLDRPKAVVFVATESGVERRFQGWGHPRDLIAAIRVRDPSLRRALDDAEVMARRWRLAFLPDRPGAISGRGPAADLPPLLADPDTASVRWMAIDNFERNDLAAEQILMSRLSSFEEPPPAGITIVRLKELFGAVLQTNSIDEREPADTWLAASLAHQEDYLAVTRDGVYVGLLSHRALVNHALMALTKQPDRTPKRG